MSEARRGSSAAATQSDVAARAGVSVTTVSRVLNGLQTVHPKIRSKVERAMMELNYTPNQVARSLRVRATKTVGMITPEIANPFAMEVASGAMRVFRREGYSTLLSASETSVENERANLQNLVDKRVDGLIITPVAPSGWELERVNEQIPVVLIDYLNTRNLDSVRVDNIEGALLAVNHLVERGYRRIATIAGPQRYTSDRERLEGFCRALARYGLERNEAHVRCGDYFVEGGYRECAALLEEAPRVDALLVANNLMGMGAVKALRDAGRVIGEDIGLCIFDDFLMADMIAPPLTVVAQPTFSIGETAARMLLERIERRVTGAPRQLLLKPELIVRGST